MRVLLALLLVHICSAAVVDISACGKLDKQNTTYRLTKNLSQIGSGACLTVTAPNPANIVIDFDGHEITFQSTAVDLGNRDGIEIINHVITTAPIPYSTAAFSWFGINGANDSASNIRVHSGTFNLIHDSAPEPYGFFVSNMASDGIQFYDNVCNIGGAYRSTCIETTGAGDKTNWKIHHNKIFATGTSNNRPTGIGLIGTVGVEVSYNEIQVNTPETVGQIDQMQSISCYRCQQPDLHHNTITEYGTHGRAFSVDNVNGGTIHHNNVLLRGNGAGGNLQGIGIRGDTHDMDIFQNVIDARGCSAPGGCNPMWIGNDTNPGDGTFPSRNKIHDNWLRVSGPATMVALAFTEDWAPGNRFWNNTISCEGSSHCHEFNPLNHEQLDGEVAFTEFINTSDAKTIRAEAARAIHDMNFCQSTVNGSPLSLADVDDHNSTLPVGEPGFTKSPCLCETEGLGCGPTVGARPEVIQQPDKVLTDREILEEIRDAIREIRDKI